MGRQFTFESLMASFVCGRACVCMCVHEKKGLDSLAVYFLFPTQFGGDS